MADVAMSEKMPRIEIVQEFRFNEAFTRALPELFKVAAGSCSCSCSCSCFCSCMCQCSGLERELVAQAVTKG